MKQKMLCCFFSERKPQHNWQLISSSHGLAEKGHSPKKNETWLLSNRGMEDFI